MSTPSATADAMGRLPCLVNPSAGRADDILGVLRSHDRLDVHECPANEVAVTVRRYVDDGIPRVVVAGGDGTIATAAKEVMDSHTELAIVPAGTLNHFARGHGIPASPEEAIEVAMSGNAVSVDAGFVNDDLFLNSSSVGAYVRFVHNRERLERRIGYYVASVVSAARTIFDFRSPRMQIEIEGRTMGYRGPLLFVGVGERELRLPHPGEPREGGREGLHVMVVTGQDARSLVGVGLTSLIFGIRGAADGERLESFVVDEFTIRLEGRHNPYVAMDGEIRRLQTPLRYAIRRSALKVVVPER